MTGVPRRENPVEEIRTLASEFPPVFELLVELCRTSRQVGKIRVEVYRKTGVNVTPEAVRLVMKAMELAPGNVSELLNRLEEAAGDGKEEDEPADVLEELVGEIRDLYSIQDVMKDLKTVNYIIAQGLPKIQDLEVFRPRDILQALVIKDQIMKRAENVIMQRAAFLEELTVEMLKAINEIVPEPYRTEVIFRIDKSVKRYEEAKKKQSWEERNRE